MNYYPFGMPYPTGNYHPEKQHYKFGDKELDEMHGLNWYDQGARMFGSILPITSTPDPMAEKYYSMSPYCQMGNNPVNAIDPDGRSTWVLRDGGSYEVFDGGLKDDDYNIYVYTRDIDGKLVRGESIGVTTSLTSFYDSDANNGKGAWAVGSIINPNDNSGKDFLNYDILDADPEIGYYMDNATEDQKYDFKATNGTNNIMYTKSKDYYRGMPLGKNNKGSMIYTSARDVGNIAAGYVAGIHGVSWSMARKEFDKLQSKQDGRSSIEGISTQNAQRLGWSMGHEKALSGLIPRLWRARSVIWDYLK